MQHIGGDDQIEVRRRIPLGHRVLFDVKGLEPDEGILLKAVSAVLKKPQGDVGIVIGHLILKGRHGFQHRLTGATGTGSDFKNPNRNIRGGSRKPVLDEGRYTDGGQTVVIIGTRVSPVKVVHPFGGGPGKEDIHR